jgi:type I restriction enzyme S subunit
MVHSHLKRILNLILPPLPEQRKIAEILETVDNAIEKTEKIIEKYKRIKQGLMQDLLTKGIDEKGNIRSEKTHKFKDSPIGRIPEEWEVVRLGEVCFLSYGKNLPKDKFKDDGKYKVYGANGVIGFYDRYTHSDLTVLVSCRGEYSGVINIAEPYSFITNNSIPLLIKNQKTLDTIFLYYVLKNVPRSKIVSGSAQPQVVISDLKDIFILNPPLSEQKRIAEILTQIDQAIEKEEKYKEKLERLKQGLMQDLLTGKVRVNHLIEEGAENVST